MLSDTNSQGVTIPDGVWTKGEMPPELTSVYQESPLLTSDKHKSMCSVSDHARWLECVIFLTPACFNSFLRLFRLPVTVPLI